MLYMKYSIIKWLLCGLNYFLVHYQDFVIIVLNAIQDFYMKKIKHNKMMYILL